MFYMGLVCSRFSHRVPRSKLFRLVGALTRVLLTLKENGGLILLVRAIGYLNTKRLAKASYFIDALVWLVFLGVVQMLEEGLLGLLGLLEGGMG